MSSDGQNIIQFYKFENLYHVLKLRSIVINVMFFIVEFILLIPQKSFRQEKKSKLVIGPFYTMFVKLCPWNKIIPSFETYSNSNNTLISE